MTEYSEDWYLENHLYRRVVELQCLETPLPVGHEVDIELPSALHMNGKVRSDDADLVVLWQNPLFNDSYEVLPKVSTSQDSNEPYRVTVQIPSHLENFVQPADIEVETPDVLAQPKSLVGMFLYIVGILDNDRRILIRGLVVKDNSGDVLLKDLEIIDTPDVQDFVTPIRGVWTNVSVKDDSTINNLLTDGSVTPEESVPINLKRWSGVDSLETPIDQPYTNIPSNWYRFDPQEAFLMPGIQDLWIYYGDPQSIDVIGSPIDISDRFLTKNGVLEFTRPGRDWSQSVSRTKNARAIWRGNAEKVSVVFKTGLNFGIAKIQLDDNTPTEVNTFSKQDGISEIEVSSGLDPNVKHSLSIEVTGRSTSPAQEHYVGIDAVKVKIPTVSSDEGEEVHLTSWGGA